MLRALTINCTLKRSQAASEPSSTARLLAELAAEWAKLEVDVESVRAADLNLLPGVTSDEGLGDDWPAVRRSIMAADIVVIGTPIWLGQPSSVCKRVLERMDAFIAEADKETGHMPAYGKVGGVAAVGNEVGAHHVCAEVFQALVDVGFTVPASASTYWVGEAMGQRQLRGPGANAEEDHGHYAHLGSTDGAFGWRAQGTTLSAGEIVAYGAQALRTIAFP